MKSRNFLYILEGKNIIPVNDGLEWAEKFTIENRRIAFDEINGIQISTVFLGIDHNHAMKGEPVLFETMIFGGEYDEKQNRYHTYDEAVEGHKAMVELIKGTMNK